MWVIVCRGIFFFFFKQKTAYEMCGRDWSSDVCSSDLGDTIPLVVKFCVHHDPATVVLL